MEVAMEFNRINKGRNCCSGSRIFDDVHRADKQFIVAHLCGGGGAIGTFWQRIGLNYAGEESYDVFFTQWKPQTQQNADGHRHCILVAASSPYPLSTPVYYPAILNLEQSGNIEAHTSLRPADAETVAKEFLRVNMNNGQEAHNVMFGFGDEGQ